MTDLHDKEKGELLKEIAILEQTDGGEVLDEGEYRGYHLAIEDVKALITNLEDK